MLLIVAVWSILTLLRVHQSIRTSIKAIRLAPLSKAVTNVKPSPSQRPNAKKAAQLMLASPLNQRSPPIATV